MDDQRRPCASSATAVDDNSGLFLQASLQLLEREARWKAEVLELHRLQCPTLPASNEVIMTGRLKKSRDGSFLHWKPKFVVISPGQMTYLPLEGESTSGNIGFLIGKGIKDGVSDLARIGKRKKDERGAKSVTLRAETCRIRPLNSKKFREQKKYVIEIVETRKRAKDGKIVRSSRLWLAETAEDRAKWISALHGAMSYQIRESEIKASSILCDSIRAKTQGAGSLRDYQSTIRSVCASRTYFGSPSGNLAVPVEWIQRTLDRPRGDVNPNMDQVFKDMQRDMVTINGKLYKGGDRGDGSNVPAIIGALSRAVMSCAAERNPMSEMHAMAFTRNVLLACNRTQSGGFSYEAVELLFGNRDHVFIMPMSAEAEPLEISIHDAGGASYDDLASGEDGDWKSANTRGRARSQSAHEDSRQSLSDEEARTLKGRSKSTKDLKIRPRHRKSLSEADAVASPASARSEPSKFDLSPGGILVQPYQSEFRGIRMQAMLSTLPRIGRLS